MRYAALLLVLLVVDGRVDTDVWPIQGHLDTYRFCDEVWTFIIKDINFKLDNASNVHSDKIKIVAMNSKKPGET